MSLHITILSGFLWRTFGASGQRLLSFVVLVILARLLSVQQFGTAATASMIVLLLFPITRFGTYDYLIQKDTIDDATRTAALAVSLIFGAVLFSIVCMSAPLVGHLFGDEQLVPALRILSTIFLFAPIGTVQEGILAKQFKFKIITGCQIASLVPSGVAGVGLALLGFGALSIVLQQVTVVLFTSLLTWVAAPWRLKIRGSWREIPVMLKMGTSYTAGQLLSSINTNLFGLGVAAIGGTDAAGLFRVALAGFTLCMQSTVVSVSAVVQPVFASLRSDAERLHTSFLHILRYFAALTFGVFAFVGAAAPDLIQLSFGNRWRDAGLPLAIMTVSIVAIAPNQLIRVYLGAIGRPSQAAALTIVESALSLLFVFSLVYLGVNGAASAVALRSFGLLPMTLFLIWRHVGIEPRAVLFALAVPLVSACFLGVAVCAVRMQQVVVFPLLVSLAVSGAVAVVVFIFAMWLIDRSLVSSLIRIIVGGMLKKTA